MASTGEWARGYARQAAADLATFDLLNDHSTPDCHRLQFLQMLCEKLCKSHLCSQGARPETLQSSHAYVARTLPVIIRGTYSLFRRDTASGHWMLRHAKQISGEIEVLAPAVKRGGQVGRPDNCEYPWEDSAGNLRLPIEYRFQPSRLLDCPAGRTFMKLVRLAIESHLA